MKPKVITKCVANHYTGPNERIIEYTFGPDGKGGSVGGLIQFATLEDGTPQVTLYNHEPQIRIRPGAVANGSAIIEALKNALKYLEHPEVQAIPFALPASAPARQLREIIKDLEG